MERASLDISALAGVRVGHWTEPEARTGCTAVLLPEGSVASGEVRGGAPATREFALLAPECTVQRLDAVVLSGGSAFGLSTCDGAMRWLEERGVGFRTRAGIGPIPIVVGMCCFDLGVGDGTVRPGPEQGYEACEAAGETVALGRVGAGTGCTTGKWHGPEEARSGGLGGAALSQGSLVVAALVACNATGWIGEHRPLEPPFWSAEERAMSSTTIGAILTNAELGKLGCHLVARSGHDGLARALDPVHTGMDGDALVCASTGSVRADPDLVRALAARAVEEAVRSLAS